MRATCSESSCTLSASRSRRLRTTTTKAITVGPTTPNTELNSAQSITVLLSPLLSYSNNTPPLCQPRYLGAPKNLPLARRSMERMPAQRTTGQPFSPFRSTLAATVLGLDNPISSAVTPALVFPLSLDRCPDARKARVPGDACPDPVGVAALPPRNSAPVVLPPHRGIRAVPVW